MAAVELYVSQYKKSVANKQAQDKDSAMGCAIALLVALLCGLFGGTWVWFILGIVILIFWALSKAYEAYEEHRRLQKECLHHVKGAFLDHTLCHQCVAEKARRDAISREKKKRQIEIARAEQERKHKEYVKNIRETSYLRDMDPYKFEDMCCDLFYRMGYDAETTSASGDHGIDGYLKKDGKIYILQAKRVKGSVGEPVLRDLFGTMHANNASNGIVVTTGKVSRQAKEWVDGKPIRIIELLELKRLIRRVYAEDELIPSSYKLSLNQRKMCPKCGLDLRRVKGKYGTFMGCSGYPTCRYTKNIRG